jgi:hypothetical protein
VAVLGSDRVRCLFVCPPERQCGGRRRLGVLAVEASDFHRAAGPAQVVEDAGQCAADLPGFSTALRCEYLSGWPDPLRWWVRVCGLRVWPLRLSVAHDEKPLRAN